MGPFGECLLATMRGLGISADGKTVRAPPLVISERVPDSNSKSESVKKCKRREWD
jgi:hypothetical protein